MLILASLCGIQDFLFDLRESGGGQARSLRNRSFRIQLIAECVALRFLEAAGLTHKHLVFNAAGKVCINAPELPAHTVDAVRATAADMENQLLSESHGRLRLSVSLEVRPGSLAEQFQRASRGLLVSKMRPHAAAACESSGWRDGALVVSETWDASTEADRDAVLGRRLVNAQWLTIRRSYGRPNGAGTDTLGFRVSLDAHEPVPADDLVSCSNLAKPESAPHSVDRSCFHPRRLARHIPRDQLGQPVEFVDLAARARGAPMLGVLKADADSLGAAVAAARLESRGDSLEAVRNLSRSLDCFFSETLEAEQTRPDSPWNSIYTVFSGGDDLLAVGPWDIMLDFAGHLQNMFNERFGQTAATPPSRMPLTISAGVTVMKPRYPIHLGAQQAEELLERAKTDKAPRATALKDQCAALGDLWKWKDHDTIIGAGRQLADWVDAGVVQRGWLHTLLELALLRRGEAGTEYTGVHPAVATSRLAYHIARNWPKAQRRDGPPPPARQWIDAVLGEFDQLDTTTHTSTIHLPAIVRYALLATRSGGSEDRS